MTLPQMLAARARRHGRRKVALREKEYGIWQEVTWEEYAAHARAVCLGLEALGLRRGDTIAILCGNRPAWLYTELGAQALGAIPAGVYVESLPEQVRYVVERAEAGELERDVLDPEPERDGGLYSTHRRLLR